MLYTFIHLSPITVTYALSNVMCLDFSQVKTLVLATKKKNVYG